MGLYFIDTKVQQLSLEEPGDSSTPRIPPIIGAKPTPQRRDLASQGRTLDLDRSLDSTAPNLSRRSNLSRQDAFEIESEEAPLSPSSNASTQDLIDAIAENTTKVSQFIGELADRVKNLETSINQST